MVQFILRRTRSATVAFGEELPEPGHGSTRSRSRGGRQRYRSARRARGDEAAQGCRGPETGTRLETPILTNPDTERTNGPAVTDSENIRREGTSPTEEEQLFAQEFVFCDAVSSGGGANVDGHAEDEPVDLSESVGGNSRKNALQWREIGRHSTDLENAAFLSQLCATDGCGKWIAGRNEKRCGMQGWCVKLRVETRNAQHVTKQRKTLWTCYAAGLLSGTVVEPSLTQLRTYVANNKATLLREGKRNTYGGLIEIVETLKDSEVKSSDDFDDASIFSISAPATESRPACHVVEEDTEKILIIFTCREFLRTFARSRSMIHGGFLSLDGKHKVNWNGYPVEPVGTMDASSTFQLEAMCIVSSESEQFYTWILEVLLEYAVKEFPMGDPFHFEGKLNFGESDSADAIGNAAGTLSSTTGWTWLNCFMHLVVCNLTRKGATLHMLLRTDEEREPIKSMLQTMAMYPWVDVFEFVMEEFLRFVVSENPRFATGFVNEYYPQATGFVTQLMLGDDDTPETSYL
ncbi:hypothetical protein CYMTET_56016 [Cymbomonas tetramitiformis]|uniref:MULE transposase domain-containing protein n=1 Tax=Cymbomonas tetramitiformis TaxID=36881 RepID=A0AAE0BCZ8_9CHLO|nr:hypothetical protein CYMTET_56016 [Cymbomonas tetramitiformis]